GCEIWWPRDSLRLCLSMRRIGSAVNTPTRFCCSKNAAVVEQRRFFLKSAGGDNPEERLLVQFQGMIAEYERAQIAERTRRGKRHRAKTGCVNVLSGAPYGYRYVRKSDAAEAYYTGIEAEAEVVREVFELYTKELWSIGAIGRHLNERGVSTRFNR